MSLDDELEAIRQRRVAQLAADQAPVDEPIERITNVTERDLADYLAGHDVAMVDCWAPWCGPCHALAPVIEKVAERWDGRVGVAKLNTDENPHASSMFRIQSIPTVLFFKGGKPAHRTVGVQPTAMFDQVLVRLTGQQMETSRRTTRL